MPFPGLFSFVSGVPAAVVPEDQPPLTNLVVWLKTPIVGLVNNDQVTTWPDSSGNGNDATQTTEADKPEYLTNQINGLDVVFIDGGNSEFLNIALNASGYTAASIFIVLKVTADPSTGAGAGLWNLSDADFSAHFPYTDGVIYDNAFSTVRKTVGNPTPSLTSFHIYDVISASGSWKARLDAVELFATGTNTVDGATSLVLGRSTIGGSFDFGGSIAEVLIYNAALSDTDRNDAETYLATRFAITI